MTNIIPGPQVNFVCTRPTPLLCAHLHNYCRDKVSRGVMNYLSVDIRPYDTNARLIGLVLLAIREEKFIFLNCKNFCNL